jgi:hypothetical protein
MERLAIIVTVLVFGPVLVGGFLNAVWPAVQSLLLAILWFFVAVAAIAGMVVFSRKLIILNEQERRDREREEDIQRASRRQREELDALHMQVRDAYDKLFDGERRRAQPRIGQ